MHREAEKVVYSIIIVYLLITRDLLLCNILQIINSRRAALGLKVDMIMLLPCGTYQVITPFSQGDVPGTIKLEDVLKRSGTGRTYLDFLDVLLTAQV